jgi:murein tripeptide amidase MpaA
MPPSGYLTVSGIHAGLNYLGNTYPSLCTPIPLPEASVEGSPIRAVKLAAGITTDRRGVLLIGGTHARELVNPDLLLSLALKLCQAYTAGSSLAFGPKVYEAGTVKLILEALDLFVLPLLNPDGRAYVQSPNGYAMWRKNRRVNAGNSCLGVDLNRNYDFLHSSGIGTSANPCDDVFRGPNAFSEPETRNVRWLLDTYPRIRGVIDVHSFKQKIYHPWGDDSEQTTEPNQNFQNPAFDGLRGNPADTIYSEYIPSGDRDWFVDAGTRMSNAIKEVGGTVYGVEPAVQLYPTSGTSKDYSYGRHFVDTGKANVYAYTVETGLEFQPPYTEALEIIKEVSAGLVQFCISVLCIVDAAAAGTGMSLDALRQIRDDVIRRSATGRQYLTLLDRHGAELVEVLGADDELRERAARALDGLHRAIEPGGGKGKLSQHVVAELDDLAHTLAARPGISRPLADALGHVRADLPAFRGRSVSEGLAELDRRGPREP